MDMIWIVDLGSHSSCSYPCLVKAINSQVRVYSLAADGCWGGTVIIFGFVATGLWPMLLVMYNSHLYTGHTNWTQQNT